MLSAADVAVRGATEAGKRTVGLEMEASNWATCRAEDAESAGNHPGAQDSLTGMATLWATPASRDWKYGEASDETLSRNARPLNGQTCSQSLAQGWVALALSINSSNFSSETLTQLGEAIKRSATTPSGGKRCWCGSPDCNLPSHKRKLNPLFTCCLMMWPAYWLTREPQPYAAPETVS